MKQFITLVLVCLVSLLVFADTSKEQAEIVPTEMYCFTTDKVANTLKQLGEVPIVIGLTFDMADSTMSLWTNATTGTWTLVATKQNLSCIIGAGNKLQLIRYGKQV